MLPETEECLNVVVFGPVPEADPFLNVPFLLLLHVLSLLLPLQLFNSLGLLPVFLSLLYSVVELALYFCYSPVFDFLVELGRPLPPRLLQPLFRLLSRQLGQSLFFLLHDCLLAGEIHRLEFLVYFLVEGADGLGREEADVSRIVFVLVGEVEGLLLPVVLNDPNPLVHLGLCVSVGAFPLDFQLLSQGKGLHFPRRSSHEFLSCLTDLSRRCLGILKGGKKVL